jgi:hypothetical protein
LKVVLLGLPMIALQGQEELPKTLESENTAFDVKVLVV